MAPADLGGGKVSQNIDLLLLLGLNKELLPHGLLLLLPQLLEEECLSLHLVSLLS